MSSAILDENRVAVSIDNLSVGMVCSHPVLGSDGVMLIGGNTRITQGLISGLRDRGIDEIGLDKRDLDAVRKKVRKKISKKRERSREGEDKWPASQPLKSFVVTRYGQDLDPARADTARDQVRQAKDQLKQVQQLLEYDELQSLASLIELTDAAAHTLIEDVDQAVATSSNPAAINDLHRRSAQLSNLGMAMAVEMGLDGQRTIEVGLAGMLHDIGLQVMSPELQRPFEQLSEAQRWEYQKHPIVSAERVRAAGDIPPSVELAIQQVHEQYNGSGFPRGVRGKRIHQYARILNVADAYLHLTSPTLYRPSIASQDAIGVILYQGVRGFFDPDAVKAILKIQTMFGLGAQVELSDGQTATVIRSARDGFAAPTVKAADGTIINSGEQDVRIVRPVVADSDQQVRVSQTQMRNVIWNPSQSSFLVR